jgi:hypothetical protein
MTTVYLSGKISGKLKYWYILQAAIWARKLAKQGYNVICPHLCFFYGLTYEQYMNNDLRLVELSDAIAMVPNWQTSRGAKIEHSYAQKLGKEVIYL